MTYSAQCCDVVLAILFINCFLRKENANSVYWFCTFNREAIVTICYSYHNCYSFPHQFQDRFQRQPLQAYLCQLRNAVSALMFKANRNSFRSEANVLLFDNPAVIRRPHTDSAPGELFSSCPPSLRPACLI